MKKVLALVLALMLCISLIPMASAEGPIKVAIMVSTVTHGWVGGVAYHAEAYAKELAAAGTIEYKMYTSGNAEEMSAQFDEAKLWGAQALVIAPQWVGMEVAAQAAIDEGLAVVAFDMDIPANGIYKVTGDNESMGVAGAEYIVEKIGTTGKVATIEVPSSGSINELRLKGFMETMAKIAPDVEILHYSAPSFAAADGLTVTADILTANPQLDAIFSEDDETSIGALQAIADAGRTDIKAITGGGGAQTYFAQIKERTDVAASSALYSPLMIKDCINVAIAAVNGESVEPVTVIPSQIVRAENVDEYIDPANTIY
ncbi:MAG: substrate-binding domain-containing protein [Clostridia bacterium]|nr:substrate-binding domain-containing protein [Clostridia bacterium]